MSADVSPPAAQSTASPPDGDAAPLTADAAASGSLLFRALLFGSTTVSRRLVLTLLVTVVLTSLVAVGGGYLIARYAQERQLDIVLRDMAARVGTQPDAEAALTAFENSDQGLAAGSTITLITPGGDRYPEAAVRVVPTASDRSLATVGVRTGPDARRRHDAVASDGSAYRVLVVALPTDGEAVLVGRPLRNQQAILATIAIGAAATVLLCAVAALIAGRLLVRSAFAPIRVLTAAIERTAVTGELLPVKVGGRAEVARLTTAFNRLMTALSSRRRQQETMLSDARHELRTPLTSMRLNVELLSMDERASMLPAGVRAEVLGDITTQITEFTSLINDLIWLDEEPQRGAGAGELVDVGVVVGDALRRARRRGHGLDFDVRTSALQIVGHPAALERAVLNLLDNAVKYSPPGGTITVELSGHQLRIADEGPGITAVDLPRIFERHYRSAGNAPTLPGTGIGLAIVADVVAQHGGTIYAQNRPGRSGAEFVVDLPSATPIAR